jgi:hypothetical protein
MSESSPLGAEAYPARERSPELREAESTGLQFVHPKT